MTDPYRILGLAPGAGDAAIRAAYLAATRACPPERDRVRFEQVRGAYEAISGEAERLSHALFSHTAPTPADVLGALDAGSAPQIVPPARLRAVLGAA
ncbi:molecular chaperone DnaJ [Massilia glaciei]|uniref:Molecular chaperone DnaJ n=1 Tax=Massilia glaciei TaxID=1524097 RepID=A0A2U2HJZ5_9BURK|nr:molecular chaperone DnaJ [Massilia glaciei]PWF47851.1 molecular chaperone DnaJ [Massilia glaciei]